MAASFPSFQSEVVESRPIMIVKKEEHESENTWRCLKVSHRYLYNTNTFINTLNPEIIPTASRTGRFYCISVRISFSVFNQLKMRLVAFSVILPRVHATLLKRSRVIFTIFYSPVPRNSASDRPRLIAQSVNYTKVARPKVITRDVSAVPIVVRVLDTCRLWTFHRSL